MVPFSGLSGAFAAGPSHPHTDPLCWKEERYFQTGQPVENFPLTLTHRRK
ncbi:MAG TPA: hypothetical protein VMM92_04800 [Thermoanaerobaculia bacterium]|nr:hypothetical protein [Thermoanaerobaculia bacterium]